MAIIKYILQGGVRWYANCGFSFRSSVSGSCRTGTLSEIRPDNIYKPLPLIEKTPFINENISD